MRDSDGPEVYTNRGAELRVDDAASLRSSTVSFVEQGFVTPLALSLTSLFRSQTQRGFGRLWLEDKERRVV
uniref:TonB-dependent receptor n=1 Tax=Steinernema glaseri TaxID=37863 RepID=A0A1I7YP67_9BILA